MAALPVRRRTRPGAGVFPRTGQSRRLAAALVVGRVLVPRRPTLRARTTIWRPRIRGLPKPRAASPTAGIAIRTFDPGRADAELRRIFALSLAAFSRNFLYTPISEAEFLAQNNAVLPFVRPELVLLAEKDGALAGFMFALPDVLQARRGEAVDTVILKTIAVHPSWLGHGPGRRADGSRAARRRGSLDSGARFTR